MSARRNSRQQEKHSDGRSIAATRTGSPPGDHRVHDNARLGLIELVVYATNNYWHMPPCQTGKIRPRRQLSTAELEGDFGERP